MNRKQKMTNFLNSQVGVEIVLDGFANPSTDLGGNAQYGVTVARIGQREEVICTREYTGYRGRVVQICTTQQFTADSCPLSVALAFYAKAQEKRLGWGKRPLIEINGIPCIPQGAFMRVPSWHPAAA